MADWIAPFSPGEQGELTTGDVRALLALGWWSVLMEYARHISEQDAEMVRGYMRRAGEETVVWIGQVEDRKALRGVSFDMGRAYPHTSLLCSIAIASPQALIRTEPPAADLAGLVWAPWAVRRITSPRIQRSGRTYTDARQMGVGHNYLLI